MRFGRLPISRDRRIRQMARQSTVERGREKARKTCVEKRSWEKDEECRGMSPEVRAVKTDARGETLRSDLGIVREQESLYGIGSSWEG